MKNNRCSHVSHGLDISPSGNMKPCCIIDPKQFPKMNLRDYTIEQYRNSTAVLDLQKKLEEGERPSACNTCWKTEDANLPSQRQIENARHFAGTRISLSIGNLCNYRCRICGPDSSTKLIKEWKTIFGEDQGVQDWYKDDKIWSNLLDNVPNLNYLQIVGGEPFLLEIDQHIELLQKCISSGAAKNMVLHYITNGSVRPTDKLLELMDQFKSVDIQFSMDGIEEQFEYNRKGGNWKNFTSNLFFMRDRYAPNQVLTISLTVSVFTVFYLEKILSWCKQNRIHEPFLNKLSNEPHYRIGVLPKQVRETIKQQWNSSPHWSLRKATTWLEEDESDLFLKFKNITRAHDQYRRESFADTFPELHQAIQQSAS